MNKLRFLPIVFAGMLILNACSKDDSRPWKDVNAESLTAQSGFDWNTTKNYQITITGNVSHLIKITSTNGTVYQKVFLVAGTGCVTTITLPAYEKSVQLVYNNKNIELALTGPVLTYSF